MPSASQSTGPIKDQQGRIRYIVDLFDDTNDKPKTFNDVKSEVDWHKAKSAQLIDDVIKLRGVDLISTTSLVGTSFTAFLTDKQVEQFSKDKLVRRLTQDSYALPRALWTSTTDASGQVRPWGLQAIGLSGGGSGGGATVYVLDTGVELHPDLPGLAAADQLVGQPGMSPVGCYPHGTHVAGIVGAADNGIGVVGVAPGVRIVSIRVTTNIAPPGQTCDERMVISAFIQALETVKINGTLTGSVGVVNVSFNDPGTFVSTGTTGEKMRNVAQKCQ